MDERCPLGLKTMPKSICPLGVQRLRAIENEEVGEKALVGCDWYINDAESNYCFFSYMADNEGIDHNTIDISGKLLITQAAVYSGLNRAIEVMKEEGAVDLILQNKDEDDDMG